MRRLSLTRTVLMAALVLLVAAGPCLCTTGHMDLRPFPAQRFGLDARVGNGDLELPFYQGWFEGKLAWYILENGSNDIMTNHWVNFKTLFPKLGSAIGNAARPVYVVLNYQQGPVFSAMPVEADYSALWQIYYVTWKPGVTKRPIISDLNLPGPAEADIVATDIVVDRPIIAIGALGGPWYPAPQGRYRLKQVWDVDYQRKRVQLPFWFAYGQDRITHKLALALVLMTDVADPALASLIGANLAPGLATMDAENTQTLWVQDWTVQPYPPPSQDMILENLPDYSGDNTFGLNDNFEFSNVMDFTKFIRTGLPPYVIIRSPIFFQSLIGDEVTLEQPSTRVNVPVTRYFLQNGPR